MQRSGLSYKNTGVGALSGHDPYLTGTDPPVLQPPDEFMPGPHCQFSNQEGLSTSAPQSASELVRDQRTGVSRRPERPFLGPPLSLRTMTGGSMSMPEMTSRDRAGTDSPTHQMQFIPTPPFPTLRHSPLEELTSSPRTERLPSFRQLSKIADGGTEGTETRPTSTYPALPSHPPTMMSQSPIKSLPYFTGSQQSSPSASFSILNHPSPTNTRLDPPDAFVVPPSPAPYPLPPDQSQFAQRRRSFGSAKRPTFAPSLTSSSNETVLSHQSSGADSYSTANTTPIESSSLDGTSRPSLPASSSMQHTPPTGGIFTCDYPGCLSAPFQTQYLLNSHANVHSSNRPHYCPVKGCPRGEGGKGFKRKNEMIRHGLVHDSPGYICPFCPLREHRYPRPDNLQRHVRVHHVDKDKDDPLLREVLSQRPEGGSRGRRRRTGP